VVDRADVVVLGMAPGGEDLAFHRAVEDALRNFADG
jgi:hypothetical protein